MLTHLLFDSFLFWSFLLLLILTSIYITKTAKKIFEYEKQVDRGWKDLIDRAEKMIKHLDDLKFAMEKKKKKDK